MRLVAIIRRALTCLGVALLLTPTSASAQLVGIPQFDVPLPTTAGAPDIGPVGVLERPRPEWQPQGLQIGGTKVLPALTAGANFDSNIFATSSNPTSDVVFRIRPELTFDSGPRALAYRFTGYGDFAEYAANGQLSNANAGALLGMRGDLAPTMLIDSQTAFILAHQDPAGFSSSVANGPVPYLPQYTTFSEALTATHEVGDLGTSILGSFVRSTYQDILVNGVLLNQTQFNGNTYTVAPKVTYLVSPPTRAFIQGVFQRNAYDSGQIDSNTYAEVLGSEFEIRRLIRGNVFAGYRERYYDSSAIGSVGGFTYGLNIAWYPAEVLTVKLSGKQDFADSAVLGANNSISVVNVKTLQGEIDYEATDQIILSAVATYENDNYLSASRIDDNAKIGANVKYLLRSGASLDLLYLYSTRQSTQTGFNYDRQQIGLALKLQY